MQPPDPSPVEPRPPETPVAEPSRDAPVRIDRSATPYVTPTIVPPAPVEASQAGTPAQPAPEETLRSILAEAVLHAFKAIDPQATMEKIARTDPQLFYKYMALLLPSAKAQSNGTNILNVIGALPRTALDKLPEGFRIN